MKPQESETQNVITHSTVSNENHGAKPRLVRPFNDLISTDKGHFGFKGNFGFIGLIPIIIGAILLYNVFQSLLETYHAQSWEKVPVKLLKLGVKTHYARKGGGVSYSIETLYQYTYKNRLYQNQRFSLATARHNFYNHVKVARAVYQRNPVFGFVNPANPMQAVLVRDITPWTCVNLWIGMFTLILGIMFFIFSNIIKKEINLMFPGVLSIFLVFLNTALFIKWLGGTLSFFISVVFFFLGCVVQRYRSAFLIKKHEKRMMEKYGDIINNRPPRPKRMLEPEEISARTHIHPIIPDHTEVEKMPPKPKRMLEPEEISARTHIHPIMPDHTEE